MEEDRGRRHRCKVCMKCFADGRALGGHMRSHMVAKDAEQKLEGISSRKSSIGGATGSYVLRKKPKKSWTVAAAGGEPSSPEKKLCRECGKGFPSWKALFGHMSCHSGKSSRNKVDLADEYVSLNSGAEKTGLGYNCSIDENAASGTTRKKKSRLEGAAPRSSSSATSELESERDKFMVTTLLMLSRDRRPWAGFGSTVESSSWSSLAEGSDEEDEDEEEELLMDGIGTTAFGLKLVKTEFDCDRDFKKKKKKYREFHISEASDDGFEQLHMSRSYVSDGDNESEIGFRKVHLKKMKQEQSGSYNGSPVIDQKNTYKCSICNRVFHSYQALGGHRAGNKRYPGGCRRIELRRHSSMGADDSMDRGSPEELIDRNVGYGGEASCRSKKAAASKPLHRCLICGKVFLTGQALGGHKRSHVAESSSAGNGDEAEQQDDVAVEIPALLDLNLPAPAESEPKKSREWWAGGGMEQEPLVGLIQ